MSALSETLLDDADWQVPSYEAALYGGKRHKYALVIPVINEGERIRGQLSRIKAANLDVDVVVADGGSTDGSLDAEFVQPVGVRAVLTKTGPGKLSAQLRMAYAWCLREGYAGVVTIDGNGKDGVGAVADFVAKLEEGCDYVQGSRYLPGGEAENTPLERTIANRLIHAPVLSIAGRHVFTDTTNGFRGYSAHYLTHPDVRPFRTEFEVYNLLFYLTVRAGQLGLKVDHVPVVRRYPESGKVPTKIGGLSSKLALLGETICAATGGYTPDRPSHRSLSLRAPAFVAGLFLCLLLVSQIGVPNYSPDSWGLYELSQTVFSDFYRFTHLRSYSSLSEYSSAFAPLWPSLIALVDGALGTGARTGLYLGFLSFLAFALVSERIGQRLTGARWFGLATAFCLLLGPSMVWNELGGGRTIPLQLLLYAIVLNTLLVGKSITIARAIVVGFVAGLAVMNRFDAALLPILLASLTGWMSRSPARGLAVIMGALIAVSPWVAYSLSTFDTVFATDNSAIALSLDPHAFVTDWWPAPQPNGFDDPAAWVLKVMGNAGQWVITGLSLVVTPMGFAFASAAVLVGVLQSLCAKAPASDKIARNIAEQFWVVAAFAALVAVLMMPQILTGYLEYRYYSAFFWMCFFVFAIWQITRARTLVQRRVFAALFAGVIAVWMIGFGAVQLANATNSDRVNGAQWSDFEAPSDIAKLRQCLGDDLRARILVMGDDKFAARAGALGSLTTMMEPRNMAEGRLGEAGRSEFIEAWAVEYLLVRKDERLNDAASLRGFAKARNCDLILFERVD